MSRKEGNPLYSYANQTDAEAMYDDQAEKYKIAKAAGHPYTLWYTLTAQEDDIPQIVLGRLPEVLTDALAPQVLIGYWAPRITQPRNLYMTLL
jgi:hypothetical protein